MTIVKSSEQWPEGEVKTCAVCGVALTSDKATAGLLDLHRHQVFACVSHFSETEKLINGWADFIAAERNRMMRNGEDPLGLIYGDRRNAWLD
jgi:hypothetical protein